MSAPLNCDEYEQLAEGLTEPATWAYLAGGAEDESTLRANRGAFQRWTFRPRVLVDVGVVTTETTVLGTPVSLPVLVAPIAFHGLFHADGELATARAAAAEQTVLVRLDDDDVFARTARSPDGRAGPHPVGAALRPERRGRDARASRRGGRRGLQRDRAHGRHAGPRPPRARPPRRLQRAGRPAAAVRLRRSATSPHSPSTHSALLSPSLTWRDIEWIAAATKLPVVLKGILTREDAVLAVEHGAAGVIVSNHGGRQLDGAPATLDALAEVAEAAAGRVEVLLDGGIRRGGDVVKALALGARAVLVGRPAIWGLAVDGEAGVRHVLTLLRDEIALTLALLGCTRPDEVGRAHVQPAVPYDRPA